MIDKKIYYFDYASTTPVDPLVLDEIYRAMKNEYGNPNSSGHNIGWKSLDLLENSRYNVAKFLNAKMDEIIFTSGATESNNIAIRGFCEFNNYRKKHIVTMSSEHKCVLNTMKYLQQKDGMDITYIHPELDGSLDLEKLKLSIRDDTVLVSIMLVNNETGVIQDIKKISQLIKSISPKIALHVDAAQAICKIPVDVQEMGIDLMSISGHKCYGPKGVGALYVKKGIRLSPIIQGGGQERGIRNGTQPLPLIIGLESALKIGQERMKEDYDKMFYYKKKILNELLEIEDVYLNGTFENSVPNIVNLSILHIEGESLMMSMPNFCLSTGSACNSSTLEPSYVISAMRNDTYYAHSAMRISFGRFTTEDEIDALIKQFKISIDKMRSISPLWEMKKNGIDINSINWDESHH